MQRDCDVCGQPLPLQSGRGRRRKRHAECSKRTPAPDVAEVLAVRAESAREAVRIEVESLGLADSPEAFAALSIASRIDAGDEPGSAHAALVKELRATLTDMRRGAKSDGPGLFDQLAQRRAENERAARGA